MIRSPVAAPFASLPRRQGGSGGRHDAMAQHLRGENLHIVRQGISAAFDQRVGLHRAIQRLRAAGADAEREPFMRARALDERQHVVDDRFIHLNLLHGALQFAQFARGVSTHGVVSP